VRARVVVSSSPRAGGLGVGAAGEAWRLARHVGALAGTYRYVEPGVVGRDVRILRDCRRLSQDRTPSNANIMGIPRMPKR
jgi:hypothetical protein